ncbi:NUDIX hydrolase [Corynebacterium diphtheriae]
MTYSNKLHEVDKDQQSAFDITGRYQTISAHPTKEFSKPTLAAGAVLWRHSSTITENPAVEFAVIHRPHYDDWSLAKGKVDPGESLPVTAEREIREETGHHVHLGKLLGKVSYPVGERTKVVYYWIAQVHDEAFEENNEVDELRWLPYTEARELLSYDVDRLVLDKAYKRLALPTTTRVILVRHAKAHQRHNWAGNDSIRPLEKKGQRQADLLGPMLAAYGPTSIHSATPARCQQTAAPLSELTGLEVVVDDRFDDEAWLSRMTVAQKACEELIATPGTHVVVSQGLFIPDAIAWLSAQGRLPLETIEAKKASAWVLSFHEGELTGADYLVSPLGVK